jgi:uncharacterized membrane protein
VAHHRQFHYIKHSNRALIWINIIFLMATCLIPFSTSLLGEYREQEISILVYGGNSIVIASVLYVQWRYVTTSRHGRLLDKNRSYYEYYAIQKNTVWNNSILDRNRIFFCVYSAKSFPFCSGSNTYLFAK